MGKFGWLTVGCCIRSNLIFVDQHVRNAIFDWESRFGLWTHQCAFDDLDAKHRFADLLRQLGR